mmetsp:Transcript_11046/g.24319  ORF Transcript_11046/g.24319 Transcript_11046/m.24319 type:complete len:211 (-) Transcript_11046:1435-2067(-)
MVELLRPLPKHLAVDLGTGLAQVAKIWSLEAKAIAASAAQRGPVPVLDRVLALLPQQPRRRAGIGIVRIAKTWSSEARPIVASAELPDPSALPHRQVRHQVTASVKGIGCVADAATMSLPKTTLAESAVCNAMHGVVQSARTLAQKTPAPNAQLQGPTQSPPHRLLQHLNPHCGRGTGVAQSVKMSSSLGTLPADRAAKHDRLTLAPAWV